MGRYSHSEKVWLAWSKLYGVTYVKQMLPIQVMHKLWVLLYSQEGDLKEASGVSNLRRVLIKGLFQRPMWSREGKPFNFFFIFQ